MFTEATPDLHVPNRQPLLATKPRPINRLKHPRKMHIIQGNMLRRQQQAAGLRMAILRHPSPRRHSSTLQKQFLSGAEASLGSRIAKCVRVDFLQAKKGVEVERVTARVSGIMSAAEFSTLDLTEQTQRAIAEMGFKHMTEVQARTIPHLLTGRDVLGAAKTGARALQPCILLTL